MVPVGPDENAPERRPGRAQHPARVPKQTLAAVGDFYTRRGLGVPNVRRLDLPQKAPRALDRRDVTRWLRAVESWLSTRDRVLALIPFYAGLRLGEVVALNLADTNPALLLNCRGGRLSARGAHDIVKDIAHAANLPDDFTSHVLRHTFGTDLVRKGTYLVLVAELMGHARIETTRSYALPTEEDRRKAINTLLTDR